MQNAEQKISEPRLTLPPTEARVVTDLAGEHGNVLEYGSGGSTVLFAAVADRTVLSVESDANWVAKMAAWFQQAPAAAKLILHHQDIGPTVAWGFPANQAGLLRWPGYATAVWRRPDFVQPDVVLVDGRFRVSCVLATALFTQKPVRLFFDDYARRTYYHGIERYFPRKQLHGRMAEFLINPTVPSAEMMSDWLPYFVDPR